MLNKFKQNTSFLTKGHFDHDLHYVLKFDDFGAYIELLNKKNKAITTTDNYHLYSGIDRQIIRYINEQQQQQFFEISWGMESGKIYLEKFDKLLALLKQSNSLYEGAKKLSFGSEKSQVILECTSNDNMIDIRNLIDERSDFIFINSSTVLLGDQIIEIQDMGTYYQNSDEFNISIPEAKKEEILSVYSSNYENAILRYEDYFINVNAGEKGLKPALIFERITDNNELVMRLSTSAGHLTPEFFMSYNISRIVNIDDKERLLQICDCDYSELYAFYSFINKILTKIHKTDKMAVYRESTEGLFILSSQCASEFIKTHLHTLLGMCELFGSEKLKSYNYIAAKPTLNIAFGDKIDYLGGEDVNIKIENESFNIFELFNLYKKHAYIPLSNGKKALIAKSYISRLQRLFKKEKSQVKISFFDLPEIEELIFDREQKVFSHSRKFYSDMSNLQNLRSHLPKLTNIKLRPYQKFGIKWLKYLYNNKFGGCLADDMGLGKTIQAIALLTMIYPKCRKPSLIIMPKSLLTNWENEFSRFSPDLAYDKYYGIHRKKEIFLNNQVILSTYATIRNDINVLKEIDFDTIILDESQNIKNMESQASKAVMLLQAEHKFALSGTPIENSLFELYSLFRFLNPGMFPGIANFKRDFIQPVQAESDEYTTKVLKAKISPFILRRLKQDVLKDLPPRQEQIIYVDMDKKHAEFYHAKRLAFKTILENQVAISGIEKSKFAIFQAFSELRQIASVPEMKSESPIPSSKIEALFEMLEDIIANRHKVLIFANFLGALDAIAERADRQGYTYLTMTGKSGNRQKLVDTFQKDKSISLFLMTLKVGGVGLNLTAADYVIIFDPWWNMAAENQAIDRTHRIGQTKPVFAYKLICKDSIEEKILDLQKKKKDLTDAIISGDEKGLKRISTEDLQYILG